MWRDRRHAPPGGQPEGACYDCAANNHCTRSVLTTLFCLRTQASSLGRLSLLMGRSTSCRASWRAEIVEPASCPAVRPSVRPSTQLLNHSAIYLPLHQLTILITIHRPPVQAVQLSDNRGLQRDAVARRVKSFLAPPQHGSISGPLAPPQCGSLGLIGGCRSPHKEPPRAGLLHALMRSVSALLRPPREVPVPPSTISRTCSLHPGGDD